MMCIYVYANIYGKYKYNKSLGKKNSNRMFKLDSRFTKFSVPLLTAILDH